MKEAGLIEAVEASPLSYSEGGVEIVKIRDRRDDQGD